MGIYVEILHRRFAAGIQTVLTDHGPVQGDAKSRCIRQTHVAVLGLRVLGGQIEPYLITLIVREYFDAQAVGHRGEQVQGDLVLFVARHPDIEASRYRGDAPPLGNAGHNGDVIVEDIHRHPYDEDYEQFCCCDDRGVVSR